MLSLQTAPISNKSSIAPHTSTRSNLLGNRPISSLGNSSSLGNGSKLLDNESIGKSSLALGKSWNHGQYKSSLRKSGVVVIN